jgi:hypothetical protein
MGYGDCSRCGSAGSVRFDMCQVCYQDFSPHTDAFFARAGQSTFRPREGGGTEALLGTGKRYKGSRDYGAWINDSLARLL